MSNSEIYLLETEWWSMELPPEWHAEQDEEQIVVGDEDGVGVLEFSTLHKREAGATKEEAVELLGDLGARPEDCEAVRLGPFQGWHRRSVDEEHGEAIREWLLWGGSLLLYVTYSCHLDHRAYDDQCVDEMLATLDFSAPVEAE